MSISVYVGMPGHGKTYGVVKHVIIPAIQKNRIVYTNIPMNEVECKRQFNNTPVHFDIEDIQQNTNWWTEVFESGSILVLDEVQKLWPAGMKANVIPEQDRNFLSEHRHHVGEDGHSTEIALITQDIGQMATFPRALIETTYRVVKLSKIGVNKKYRVDVFFGPVKHPYPANKRDNEFYGAYKKEVYCLYTSHTKSMTGNAGDETRTDKRFSILSGWRIKAMILFVILAVPFVIYALEKVANRYNINEETEIKVVSNDIKKENVIGNVAKQVNNQIKKIETLLSNASNIYISFNNGIYPKVDYLIKIVYGRSEVTMNPLELYALGYSVTPLDQCLIKITGNDYDGYIMCQSNAEEEGMISGFVKESIPVM